MKLVERVITDTVVLGLLVFFVGFAIGYPPQARLVPLVVGIPALILMGAEYIGQITLRRRMKAEELEKPVEFRAKLRVELGLVGWLGWLALASYLFGFRVSIPLFMLPLLRFRFSQNLTTSVILTATVWIVLYVSFEQLLKVPLNCGVLLHY